MVLSRPATNTASKPRSDELISGTAEIWMTSTSLASKAGRARVEDMEIISTSKPSLAKPPVSFAIHMDAMVPDVNKKAMRSGRVAAARPSVVAASASKKARSTEVMRQKGKSTDAARYRCRESFLVLVKSMRLGQRNWDR